ncbi:enoyl-CoA hydratase/isomerase family protein (plasmid) [Nocardioides sp. R1-1]|uniref:enoyl-CoA hydratase/isomerase family protein n=1 Tax=Nocardioides sp. R1-1 TaxID=3383502 RepID=UPI0038CF5948
MSGLLNDIHRPSSGPTVRLLRLDRAARRNALDMAAVEGLLDALNGAPEQCVVLGSSTPGMFCAGADLGVPDAERAEVSERLYECYEAIVRRPGLVAAVVDGAAVGGGAQLAAAADIRVAGPSARWRWVGPGHGLAVGAWILPHLVGRSRALDLTLTGRWLELPEARDAGFVHRVDEDPWAATLALVEDLGRLDSAALATVKAIATSPQVLESLEHERRRNGESWDGHAPPPPRAASAHP